MKKQFFITISLVLLILTQIYSSEPEWVTLPDMPRERFGHCAVVYRDKVWIIGGKNQKGNSIKTVDCYDLIKNEWLADASELLQARYNATAAVYDDKIFVMGGYDERQILNSVEYYDSNDNEWKELAPLLTQREGANAVVFHDTLFVIGGRSNTGILPKILDSIEFWDSSAQRWQEHPTWHLEHARVLMQSVVVDNYIYTLGGQFIDSELNFVERFGLNGKSESRSPLNIPRFYFSAVKIESLIYVLGGVRSGEFEAITDTIEYYAPNHDRWYTLDVYMKRPRAGLSAVSYHNNIYVFGGMDINLKIWNTAEVLTGVPVTVDTNTTVVNRNEITEHPAKHSLIKNYPNPFNSATTITFELAQDESQVQLIIFNMLGGKVRTFLLNSFSPGVHQIEWDGCDDQGRILESGIYLAQLRSDRGYGEVLKLSFIK
jgi:N-acetylneuraminic acid mutarotase